MGDYDFNKILQMYFDFVDEETVTETDVNIAYSLIIVTAIYHKYVNSDGFFDFRDFLVNDLQAVYNTFVRPDLLKLYEMFHEKKHIKSNRFFTRCMSTCSRFRMYRISSCYLKSRIN